MTDDCQICKHNLPGDCTKRELVDGYLKFPQDVKDGCCEPIEKIKQEVFDSVFVKKQAE